MSEEVNGAADSTVMTEQKSYVRNGILTAKFSYKDNVYSVCDYIILRFYCDEVECPTEDDAASC